MRTLKLHFSEDALPTLDTFLKRTKEARVFRRTQAVRAVVTGQRLQTVSDTLHFTYSALRKWVHRFATQGTQGLVDRPRSGRPPKVTCVLEQHLNRLVDHDPLSMAPSTPSGVVASSPPSSPSRPVSNSVVQGCAGVQKNTRSSCRPP